MRRWIVPLAFIFLLGSASPAYAHPDCTQLANTPLTRVNAVGQTEMRVKGSGSCAAGHVNEETTHEISVVLQREGILGIWHEVFCCLVDSAHGSGVQSTSVEQWIPCPAPGETYTYRVITDLEAASHGAGHNGTDSGSDPSASNRVACPVLPPMGDG